MTRSILALSLLLAISGLVGCKGEQADAQKEAVAEAPLVAPTGTDDASWKQYLQQVVARNQSGVTDRVYPYYLPANSGTPDDADPEKRSQYDRQLENVAAVVGRTVLPGNMLAFGSPDSTKMADLIVAAFEGAKMDALKGSQVLFIGHAADNDRVKAAVEAVGARYVFVEVK
ncbi:hypothetical protein [Arenimonas sp.]|uniref:hypothetical protein n=1 Tax=Arenimonas sp. TaxID=1872635 RepID=UPI0039E57CCF